MKYREVNEHYRVGNMETVWLSHESKERLMSGDLIGSISDIPLRHIDHAYGLIEGDALVAYFNVQPLQYCTQMKRLEVSPSYKGTGLAGKIAEFLLSKYKTLMSDDVMSIDGERYFQNLMKAHYSGIIDSFTGKVYRLEDAGKEIEGNIVILSPEKDNMNMDRRPNGKPVERPDYVHRFYWILSNSPLSYEEI